MLRTVELARSFAVPLAWAALLVAFAVPRASQAEERASSAEYGDGLEEEPRSGEENRSVGGHSFAPFRTVAFPFVATRFGSATSVGVAEFKESPRALDFEFEGNFATLREEVLFGVALRRWLGLELSLEGAVFGGTDRDGALIIGANGALSGSAAVVVRLVKTKRFVLSIRGRGRATRFEGISPVRVFDAFRAEEGLSLSNLSASFDGQAYAGSGEVAAAIGLSPAFGLQASARAGGRSIDVSTIQEEEEGFVEGALGVSVDLSRAGPGLRLAAGGRVGRDFGDDESDLQLAAVLPSERWRFEPEVGIYYSGRPDFELGLGLTGLLTENDKRAEASIRMDYFW